MHIHCIYPWIVACRHRDPWSGISGPGPPAACFNLVSRLAWGGPSLWHGHVHVHARVFEENLRRESGVSDLLKHERRGSLTQCIHVCVSTFSRHVPRGYRTRHASSVPREKTIVRPFILEQLGPARQSGVFNVCSIIHPSIQPVCPHSREKCTHNRIVLLFTLICFQFSFFFFIFFFHFFLKKKTGKPLSKYLKEAYTTETGEPVSPGYN